MEYGITYKIELFANFAIEAESERDALRIGYELLDNDTFRVSKLIPAFDDPFQWGDALADCGVSIDTGYEDGDLVLNVSDYIEE